MRKESVRLTFYKISECGFYRFGKKKPEFGLIDDVLLNLQEWCKGRPLEDTSTFDFTGGVLKAYCCDIFHNTQGDCVVVTWNESTSDKGKMLSVDGKKLVGEVNIDTTKIPKGGIPGHPTYFWFIPSLGLVATIQIANQMDFERQPNGVGSLKEYIKNFITWYSKYVDTSVDSASGEIIVKNHKRQDGEVVIDTLYPKFDFKLDRKESPIKSILDRRTSIRKIQRKSVLHVDNNSDLDISQKLLQKIGFVDAPTIYDELKIRYEISYTPDEAPLKAMITQWEQASHDGKVDDVGFVFANDANKTVWLSSAVVKEEVEINLKDNKEYHDAETILDSLTKQKSTILAIIKKKL